MKDENKLNPEDVKSKGKGKPFRGKGKGRPLNDTKVSKICMNDPNWYIVHPELLKDVASLAFAEWLGRGFKTPEGHAAQMFAFGMRYVYTLGMSKDAQSPANLAIRNMYTFVRHANSGHTNYESPDLGIYLFEVGGLIATLAHIERALGVAKYYQTKNLTVPAGLLNILGFTDWNTKLLPNLANYTAKLNTMWARLSSLCIPKSFKFIERWIWMNSQVFKDHESRKSQLIAFVPCGVPLFTQLASGGAIKQENYKTKITLTDDWFNEASVALDTILGDEDMNIMSGDILKAYGEENLYKFGMTPLEYVVEPRYVDEMLPQIENLRTAPFFRIGGGIEYPCDVVTAIPREAGLALGSDFATVANSVDDRDAFYIYQAGGEIISTPCFNYGATNHTVITDHTCWCDTALDSLVVWGSVTHQTILNSKKESPTPEDVIISTRLAYTESAVKEGSSAVRYIESCGTEIVVAIDVGGRDLGYSADFTYYTEVIIKGTGSNYEDVLWKSFNMTQFDWTPITYIGVVYSSQTNVYSYFNRLVGDFDNFTYLVADRLEAMHLNAILGEFNVTNLNFLKV